MIENRNGCDVGVEEGCEDGALGILEGSDVGRCPTGTDEGSDEGCEEGWILGTRVAAATGVFGLCEGIAVGRGFGNIGGIGIGVIVGGRDFGRGFGFPGGCDELLGGPLGTGFGKVPLIGSGGYLGTGFGLTLTVYTVGEDVGYELGGSGTCLTGRGGFFGGSFEPNKGGSLEVAPAMLPIQINKNTIIIIETTFSRVTNDIDIQPLCMLTI